MSFVRCPVKKAMSQKARIELTASKLKQLDPDLLDWDSLRRARILGDGLSRREEQLLGRAADLQADLCDRSEALLPWDHAKNANRASAHRGARIGLS